jgi:kynurenine formamidase
MKRRAPMSNVTAHATDLLESYRIVDLSHEIHPGVLKINGNYVWGKEQRRFEIRQFIAPGPHLMNFVETESHVGTHVEVPCHMVDGAKSVVDLPLQMFFGEAIVLKFADLEPGANGRRMITTDHLRNVRANDIVLMWSPFQRGAPLISTEAAHLLAKLPIKMLGIQNVGAGNDTHDALLVNADPPIPIIEQLENLDELRRERVLYFGLPIRIADLDSSWVRAMAFEPRS